MTPTTNPAAPRFTHWMIFDGVGAVDGVVYATYSELLSDVSYHDKLDYIVLGFNPKTMQMADVTEQVAKDWWKANGQHDTFDAITGGEKVCWLAHLYFRDAVNRFEQFVYASEIAADRHYDMRVGA